MDLIVCRGMGGKGAKERIRAIDPLAKKIVTNGYSHNSITTDYENHGFSGVIEKPYRLSDLKKRLEQVIRH